MIYVYTDTKSAIFTYIIFLSSSRINSKNTKITAITNSNSNVIKKETSNTTTTGKGK